MTERYEDRYFTNRDGLRLHYRDYPGSEDRLPLLCLPGLTRNARDFAELAERLSPRFRVIALDFRGRAESDYDPIPGRYLPPTYVYDVIELLDGLALAQAVFIGTSLGGLVTMLMAVMAPQRIAASIINASASKARTDNCRPVSCSGSSCRSAGGEHGRRWRKIGLAERYGLSTVNGS